MKRSASLFLALLTAQGPVFAAQPPGAASAPLNTIAPPTEILQAPKAGTPTLTLAEAVRLTMLHDPRLQAEQQKVNTAFGQLREATGAFDFNVSSGPSYGYTLSELNIATLEREAGKRQLIAAVADEFERQRAVVRAALQANELEPPRCPEGFSVVSLDETSSEDVKGRTGLVFEDTVIVLPPDLTRNTDTFFDLCSPPAGGGATPQDTLEFIRAINTAAQVGLQEEVAFGVQAPSETLRLIDDVVQTVAIKAALARERQGGVPVDEVSENLAVRAGLSKLFRNGALFRTDFRISGTERNYKDKSLDPSFGGMGVHNEFPSFATLSVKMPLGKDRGSVSTAAPERAAGFNLRASRDTLREIASEEAFSTILAYVGLQAAQQSLALLEESSARQQKLVELSQQLVNGGELAASELDRMRGRAALVASQVADARRSVIQARVGLAQAIGLAVDKVDDAPLAADAATSVGAAPASGAALVQKALANRRQLKAATYLQDAARVLARGSRSDLKRRVDFTLTAGMNTLYESPFLRVLGEEQEKPVPYVQGSRFSSPRGYFRSLGRTWKPQVSAQLTFDLPFKNNAARGRFVQDDATFRQAQIQRQDLERTIRDNVTDISYAVRRAAEAMDRNREALGLYEKTLNSALERYQAGDITLLDTIVTEEDLTRQRQQYVRSVQTYLSLLARLKFETGDLLQFHDEGSAAETAAFEPSAFIAR